MAPEEVLSSFLFATIMMFLISKNFIDCTIPQTLISDFTFRK